jgi:putative transposase
MSLKTEQHLKYRSWELPEPLWECIKPLVSENKEGKVGRPRSVNFRKILSGIFYVLRTGIQWQALPRELFGPPSTVYYWFSRWCKEGVFETMWQQALKVYDDLEGLEWNWQSIDGATTKAPLGGEATGPNPTDRAKLGTKRSVLTEGKGVPIAIVISGANKHDVKLLEKTLDATIIQKPDEVKQHLCGDKGYDSKNARKAVKKRNYIPHIRSRREETCNKKKERKGTTVGCRSMSLMAKQVP